MRRVLTTLALVAALVLGMAATAFAAPKPTDKISNDLPTALYEVTAPPQHSEFDFTYTVPSKLVAGVESAVDVTFAPVAEKELGYDSVRFNVGVTGPEGSTTNLWATDSLGHDYDIAALGYWGPAGGFPIAFDYSATTEVRATFSLAGDYTVTFSLVDMSAEEAVIVTRTQAITVEAPLAKTAWLNLTWTAASSGTATVGTPFPVATTATKNAGILTPIDRVLYIIEITKNGTGPATASDVTITVSGQDGAGADTLHGVNVPYSTTFGCFFFGTSETAGFTFSATDTIANLFTITFHNAGTYVINAYAVQLPGLT